MSGKTRELWVWAGTREAGRTGLELCRAGRRIAQEMDAKVIALLPGPAEEAVLVCAGQSGAQEIVILRDEFSPSREGCAAALLARIQHSRPELLLFPADPEGRELSVRLAAALGTGAAQDCTDLEWSREQGRVLFTRPVQGGRQMALQMLRGSGPQIAALRPGACSGGEQRAYDWPFPLVREERASLSS